eukprot:gene34878-43007_t
MAAELGPDNIRVNCLNPVFNPDTGLAAEFAGGPVDDARRAKFLATIPLGRFSTAQDVANAALYLASDEAAFISGVCIENLFQERLAQPPWSRCPVLSYRCTACRGTPSQGHFAESCLPL